MPNMQENLNELNEFISKTLDEVEKLKFWFTRESLKSELIGLFRKVDYNLLSKWCLKCWWTWKIEKGRCKYCSWKWYKTLKNE